MLQWTQGKALIATGSPFDPVEYDGRTYEIAQCNNALSFPGIGLGIIATQAKELNANMLWAASVALSDMSPVRSDPSKPILPGFKAIRKIALVIAQKVARQADEDNLARLSHTGNYSDLINEILWKPYYRPIKPRQKT